MIAVLSRCALGAERQDDLWTAAAEEEHDLADEPVLIDIAQAAIRMARRRERPDPEHTRRRRQLGTPSGAELGTRRNGDAGSFSSIPVSRAKNIDSVAARRQFRERSSNRERFVVGMGEDASEPMHLSRR